MLCLEFSGGTISNPQFRHHDGMLTGDCIPVPTYQTLCTEANRFAFSYLDYFLVIKGGSRGFRIKVECPKV